MMTFMRGTYAQVMQAAVTESGTPAMSQRKMVNESISALLSSSSLFSSAAATRWHMCSDAFFASLCMHPPSSPPQI